MATGGDHRIEDIQIVECKPAVSESEHLAAYIARLGGQVNLMFTDKAKGLLYVSNDWERFPPGLTYAQVARLVRALKRNKVRHRPAHLEWRGPTSMISGRVVLCGLEGEAMNGQYGTVISWRDASECWEVQLDDHKLGATIDVVQANVQLLKMSWAERSRSAKVWATVRQEQLQLHSDEELLQAKNGYIARHGQEAFEEDDDPPGRIPLALVRKPKAMDFNEQVILPAIENRESLFLFYFQRAVRASCTLVAPHRSLSSACERMRPPRAPQGLDGDSFLASAWSL